MNSITRSVAILTVFFAVTNQSSIAQDQLNWQHGTTTIGEIKYEADFPHFDYVDPDAPKGGTLRLSATDSFDNLNALSSKGELATGLGYRISFIYETLMTPSEDEVSSEYGLLAEAMAYPEDYAWVKFRLRETATWHDGVPITPDDVIFTFNSLTENNPKYADYYKHVEAAEQTGPREITFTFDEVGNQELPHILGQLMIVPKHWWTGTDEDGNPRDIAATTLEAPLGSGPYRVSQINAGSSMTFERVDDYWGKDINVNVGRYNFDEIKVSYFADSNVRFEAFKADEFDFWRENEAKRWANSYDFPAYEDGRVTRETLDNEYRDYGILWGFLPNLRREKFQDPRVREALNLAFDFEELNRTIFFNAYERINSFFYGTELASSGLPEGRELEILKEYEGQIPDSVFTETYQNPIGGSPDAFRTNLSRAAALFKDAGYEIKEAEPFSILGFISGLFGGDNTSDEHIGKMVHTQTGEPFTFELILNGPILEKVALPYIKNLNLLGIDVDLRVIDSSQYLNRRRDHDYDIIHYAWAQSLRPGNEQLNYWGSESVNKPGSENYVGISDPAIDAIIQKIIFSDGRDELIAATRALDRVLLHSHFVVPTYTLRHARIAYWDRFKRPEKLPEYSIGFPHTWWSKLAN